MSFNNLPWMSEGDLIEILQWVLSFKKLSFIGTFHDSLLEMLTPEDMKMEKYESALFPA